MKDRGAAEYSAHLAQAPPPLLLSISPCNDDQIRKLWFLNPLSLRRFNQLKLMLAATASWLLSNPAPVATILEKDPINKVSVTAG